MPAIKYKPSADCAYTQLISKIKGVHGQTKSSPPNPPQNETIPPTIEPKTDVEVKKISNGLMLAQYYNSDSEDEEENQIEGTAKNGSENQPPNGTSQSDLLSIPTLSDEIPIPAEIQCPPQELKIIIDKTASYVLKNGKDFEDILRAKNDQRFTFLQYKDPYFKYYTFKLTGIVCPDPANISNTNNVSLHSGKSKNLGSHDTKSSRFVDISKHIGKPFSNCYYKNSTDMKTVIYFVSSSCLVFNKTKR